MSDEWPVDNLPVLHRSEREPRMTNDHGILYLVGEHTEGEWMFTENVLPPKYQNIR